MKIRYFVDTETTGLDPRIHWAYEAAWMSEYNSDPDETSLPHTLEYASEEALAVGQYRERGFSPDHPGNLTNRGIARLRRDLRGNVLIGWNVDFDASFLTKAIGYAPWDYHTVNAAQAPMWLFGWDRPRSLTPTVEFLRERGHQNIPDQTHTARGDVLTLAAVWFALIEERNLLRHPAILGVVT